MCGNLSSLVRQWWRVADLDWGRGLKSRRGSIQGRKFKDYHELTVKYYTRSRNFLDVSSTWNYPYVNPPVTVFARFTHYSFSTIAIMVVYCFQNYYPNLSYFTLLGKLTFYEYNFNWNCPTNNLVSVFAATADSMICRNALLSMAY